LAIWKGKHVGHVRLLEGYRCRRAPGRGCRRRTYPYLIIDNFIRQDALAGVVKSFPVVPKRGSVPLDSVPCSGAFAALMEGDA
jgi:hypothetical protein